MNWLFQSLPEMRKGLKELEIERKKAIKLQSEKDNLIAMKHKLAWAFVAQVESVGTIM